MEKLKALGAIFFVLAFPVVMSLLFFPLTMKQTGPGMWEGSSFWSLVFFLVAIYIVYRSYQGKKKRK